MLKNKLGHQLSGLCETRWVERHDGIIQFRVSLPKIVTALDDVAEWEDLDAAAKAKSLQTSLCDSETLFGIFCLSDVLSITLPLSKFFQRINIDLKSSQEILNDTITILQWRREKCERYFATLYDEVCGVAEELGVDIKIPRTTTRNKHTVNIY